MQYTDYLNGMSGYGAGGSPGAGTGNSGGGAAYPGLGAPISAFGYQNGQPSLGPFSFLPQYGQQQQQGQTPGTWGGGSHSTGSSGPTDAASGFLNGVLDGKNLPYDAATQSAELTSASDMSSAAEQARNEASQANAIRGGAAANDPSAQGAKLNSMARRQSDNSASANSIQQNASKANFSAKMNAAGELNQSSMERQRLDLERQRMQQEQAMRSQQMAMSFLPQGGGQSHGRSQSTFFGGFGGDDRDPYGRGRQTPNVGFNPGSYNEYNNGDPS